MLIQVTTMTKTLIVLLLLALLLPVDICQAQTVSKRPATQELIFAYFPMAVPASVLGETIKRDRLLERNFRRHGVKLTFRPFNRGNETMGLIKNNQIAAVAFGDMPTIEACVIGKMLIVGQAKHGYSIIVGPKGSHMRDLRTKRIGNATGSTGHYALLQALASADIPEHHVTIVPMQLHEMQPAIAAGKIDAFAAWEPIPSATLQAYPNRFDMLHRQVSLMYILVSQQLAESRPEAANELAAAFIRALRWLRQSSTHVTTASKWAQQGMVAFSGKPSTISIDEIARITRSEMLDIIGLPQLPLKDSNGALLLSREFDFMQKHGWVPSTARWEQVQQSFKRELMVQLLKKPAKYGLNRFDYAP